MKRVLTDKLITNLKKAPPGTRQLYADVSVPGLGVRVTDKGHRTFILGARYPGSPHFKRIELGEVGALTLAAARTKAREWLALIKAGEDPRRIEAARLASAENTFGALCERFITSELPKQRRGRAVERLLRSRDAAPLLPLSLPTLTHRHIRETVSLMAARAPAAAHNLFDALRAVCEFAVHRGMIEVSPCAGVKPSRLIGPERVRTRVLSDSEIRAVWRAAGELGYPWGMMVKMLLLTGCRVGEVAGARWDEFDLTERLWRIPPARFKSNVTHVVPVTDDLAGILGQLPRWGDFLFTTTGDVPVHGFHARSKRELDRAAALEAPYQLHDLRRTMRTRLSGLRVPDHIAELSIGHARTGLQRVYDQHSYLDELRSALEAWHRLLAQIIEGKPGGNVLIFQSGGVER